MGLALTDIGVSVSSGTASASRPAAEGRTSSLGSLALPERWKVCGDHRCLFRAVSRAVTDPGNTIERDSRGEAVAGSVKARERQNADDLRKIVCEIMRAQVEEVAGLLGGTHDSAIQY